MYIELPIAVQFIIDTLMKKGFSAYAVGGCVRDSLLNRSPEDWDITTSAQPEDVKNIFNRTVDTGLQHGTVTVLIDHKGYEVTTYRIDGDYEDNRRPKSVEFTSDLIEDLRRRDFTINAMAYNYKDGLVDVFEGQKDLQEGLIRCVGIPKERFNEDGLRMLRAIRFSAQLGFNIDSRTEKAILEDAQLIKNISAERVQVELTKLLSSQHPHHFEKLYTLGLLEYIMPEFLLCFETSQNNPHHQYDVGEHSLKALGYIDNLPVLRWTMLFHDIGKPYKKSTDEQGIDHFYGHSEVSSTLAKKILKRLKLDNKTIEAVYQLVYYHDMRFPPTPKSVRKAINKIGVDLFPMFLQVQEADVKAQSSFKQEDKLKTLKEIKELYENIIKEKQCITLQQLEIDGRDILNLGVKPGKIIGEILDHLLQLVLENPEINNKYELLNLAEKYIQTLN